MVMLNIVKNMVMLEIMVNGYISIIFNNNINNSNWNYNYKDIQYILLVNMVIMMMINFSFCFVVFFLCNIFLFDN